MSHRIVPLDLESTGVNPYTDRIVEIAVGPLTARCNPGVPIAPSATKVHGITDAEVKDCPPFAAVAAQVQAAVEGAVTLTYSGRSFDTVLLDAELRRAGQPGIDLQTVREIDLYRVWVESEPRTLTGAVRRFLGQTLEGAHGAKADAHVLPALMEAMGRQWGLSFEDLVARSRPLWEVDRSGRLRRNDEGVVCWNFGQHMGQPVTTTGDYAAWVLSRDFPPDTKEALRRVLDEARKGTP